MSVEPLSILEKDQQKICDRINQLMQGRSNAIGTVTLSTGATSTTVSDQACGGSSIVFLSPRTANAAIALATTCVKSTDVTPKQFIVTHASSSSTDRTFGYIALG